MAEHLSKVNITKIKRWSPVWVIPIITFAIGAWILFYHFSTQGPLITLVTTDAEGIVEGKTAIKSRSVDIGIVESVVLNDNLNNVVIKARLNSGMESMLSEDSVFWVVKPQIGRAGVSGLGTLFSGAYIEVQPGKHVQSEIRDFILHNSPPLAAPDARGLRIFLESAQAGALEVAAPVLFRGLKVGSVETRRFETESRVMRYQVFISAPYDQLVTSNVRFWIEDGFSVDMSSEGITLEMASFQTLLDGGVSFDVPVGWATGESVIDGVIYQLYADRNKIQDSLLTEYKNYILFFNESIRGLSNNAPVEFRGIRIGTVVEAPYYLPEMWQMVDSEFLVPVLIRIEPERLNHKIDVNMSIEEFLQKAQKNGLRASLESGNLLTGALFVNFDFYKNLPAWQEPKRHYDYPVLPSVSGGLAQLQQKLMVTLDKINALPLNNMVTEISKTFNEGQKMVKSLDNALVSVDKIISRKETQSLPRDLQDSLQELNRTLQGIQPGSPAYSKLMSDMERFEQVLREMQPILRTLNEKSNALVFEAPAIQDPQPKRAK